MGVPAAPLLSSVLCIFFKFFRALIQQSLKYCHFFAASTGEYAPKILIF